MHQPIDPTRWRPMTCPECGYTPDTVDDFGKELDEFEQVYQFEIGGACPGCVFCPRCACEFNPETGEPHDRTVLRRNTSGDVVLKITYGPRRRFVPVCHRTEFGFIGGPIRYEENYDRRTSVIVVDGRGGRA